MILVMNRGVYNMKFRKLLMSVLAVLMVMSVFGCSPKQPDPEPETAEAIKAILDGVKESGTRVFLVKSEGSDDLNDYKDKTVFAYKDYGLELTEAALQDYQSENVYEKVNVARKDTLDEALTAFLQGSDSVLVADQGLIDALKDTVKYAGINEKLKSIYTYDPETAKDFSLVNGPFQIALFGSDERKGLKVNSRYDTSLLVTVNPETKQILVVATPRDSMLPNHAYNDQKDKLTHTGDGGPENALYALNWLYHEDYEKYVLLSFQEFTKFIDLLGGIDVYNAKGFTYGYQKDLGYFAGGNIHLDGGQALYFARERWHLNNGDFDRNANAIVLLKGIINKLLAFENLAKFNEVYQQLRDCFYTNLDEKEILGFVTTQYKAFTEWEIISYHIGGTRGYDWCPSYKTNAASVHPSQADADFCHGEMEKMMNGETIYQQHLPSGIQ